MGKMIPLPEWARRVGIHPATARQKALRGGFVTAERVGTVWLIDEDESHVDLRRGEAKADEKPKE